MEQKYRITYETNERGEKAYGDTNTVEAMGINPYAAVASVCKSEGPDRWGQDDVALVEEITNSGEQVLMDVNHIFQRVIATYPQPYISGLKGNLVPTDNPDIEENVVLAHSWELVDTSVATGVPHLGEERELVLQERRPQPKNAISNHWGYTIAKSKLGQAQKV